MVEINVSVKEMQKLEYEILKFIKDVCRKNQLRYYLAYGTLLGAVRHNGFIPWDDDIDIMMPRYDYNKFLKAVERENHPYYRVVSKETEKDFTAPLPKVIDSRIELIQDYGFIEKVVLGPYVDLFILDGCGKDEKQAQDCFTKSSHLYRKWMIADTDFKKDSSRFDALLKELRHFPIKVKGYEYYLEKIIKKSQMYDYDKSEYIGLLMFASEIFQKCIWNKEKFGQGVELAFENEKFTVPVAYNEILTLLYGDFMKLPPLKEQMPHHKYTLRIADNCNLEDYFRS